MAGFILVFITYYVFNWAVSEKDTIFEIQDAYLHLKLIDSWQDLSDTVQISKELKALKIDAYVYKLDADTLCENSLLVWSNSKVKTSSISGMVICACTVLAATNMCAPR